MNSFFRRSWPSASTVVQYWPCGTSPISDSSLDVRNRPLYVAISKARTNDAPHGLPSSPCSQSRRPQTVRIGKLEYPTRQVVALATGRPSIKFTSAAAYRILQKFGFDIDVWE